MSPHRSRYVERVREATRALFEDLLQANRRLCLAISVLGADRDEPQRELDDLRRKSLRWLAEKQGVLELLEAVDRESRNFEEQFVEVERQNSNLATLFAASHALHSSVEEAQVLQAIQEVVINLIGSEEFAIVSADDAFAPRALFGVTSEKLRGLSVRSGIIGRAVSERRPLALPCGVPVDASGVRVCIPLHVAGKTLGFVLIFGFLPQKSDILPVDYELFSLVGTQAASALYAAELHAAQVASSA
jgi:hypothetical protein